MMLPEMTSSAHVARAFQRFARGVVVGLALAGLAACGGGGSSKPATPAQPETPAEQPEAPGPTMPEIPITQAVEVGQKFRNCPECPEMVVVPAGSFLMGSPESEELRDEDEGPVHRVTIARPFAVGVYEATFDEWDACAAGGGCGGYRPTLGSNDRRVGGRAPVTNVSWNHAQAYVRWLSEKTGGRYRLLSESEWEYVARAGTTTRFWWGDEFETDRPYLEIPPRVVGSSSPNAFGLYDVHGNVAEWVEDCPAYRPGRFGSRIIDYVGAPSDGSAWTTVGAGAVAGAVVDCSVYRGVRGGPPIVSKGREGRGKLHGARSASRSFSSARDFVITRGFRVARTLTP